MLPCYSLHSAQPLLPLLHFYKSVLKVWVSIAALQIGPSVSFLDSTYMPYYMICVFFFLITSLYIKGSSFIHLIRTDSNAFLFMAE